jgi:hypothetical protein
MKKRLVAFSLIATSFASFCQSFHGVVRDFATKETLPGQINKECLPLML